MIKQNPMNEIVKIQHPDGRVELIEMAPSQISDLVCEIYDEDSRWKRKSVNSRLRNGGEVYLPDGRKVKIIRI